MPINSDRYIGSDEAFAMQQQATATVGNAVTQANKQASDSIQQYLSGSVQNSQRIVELENARAQVAISQASHPNAVTQFADAAVKAYGTYQQQQAKVKAKADEVAQKAAEDKAAIATSLKYTDLEDKLTKLESTYRNSGWDGGQEGYKRDASELLSQYKPTSPEEAKEFQRIAGKVNDTYLARNVEVAAALEKKQTQTIDYQTDVAKATLLTQLQPQLTWIAKGDFADQATTRLKAVGDSLETFLKDDNGLPYTSKLKVVAEITNLLQTKYGEKLERYTEYQSNLRDYNIFASQSLATEQAYANGQIGYEEYVKRGSELELKYPGLAKFAIKRGDREKLQLDLANINKQQQDLLNQGLNSAALGYGFTSEDTKALTAAIYNDAIFAETLANNPQFKDNPGIKAAVNLSGRIRSFVKEQTTLNNSTAEIITNQARTNLQSIDQYASTLRSIANKQSQNQQLSQTELILQAVGSKIQDPFVNQILQQRQQGQPVDTESLNRANALFTAGVNDIIKSQQQEIQVRRNGLLQNYKDLLDLGFIDNQGQVNQNAINSYSKNAPTIIEKARQNIERQRLELQQQLAPPPQYGVQPNFSQSSAYAPVTDDRGQLVLVPRTSVSQLKLADGTKISTPVILNGSNSITSSYGMRQHPVHGGQKFHAGTDLAAPMGAKAVSMVSGTVVFVGNQPGGYGGYVDVLGDNGFVYRYGHQRPLVKTGTRVYPGQVVSESNGSGGITGPHLHFEVHTRPNIVNGKYTPTYQQGDTTEPIAHLKQLSAGASNVLSPRGNATALARQYPQAKVPANSTLTSNGGAINGQTYQRAGSIAGQTSQRFGSQRPVSTGSVPYTAKVGSVSYDANDDMGYAVLRQNTNLRNAMNQTAKNLGIPAQWIADIAAQESGGIQPYINHHSPNGNYGLFGFGNDSFNDPNIHKRLVSGQIDGAGQVKLFEQYMKENGWNKFVQKKQGNVSIADVWSFIRFGTARRNRFQETGDVNIPTEGGLKFIDELKLLGKHVGRHYQLPGLSRQTRASAPSDTFVASCPLCNQLAQSDAFVPHVHSIG